MGNGTFRGAPEGNAKGSSRNLRPRSMPNDLDDPYQPNGHYPDGTVCSSCGAVYHNQHWNLDQKRAEALTGAGANTVVCPGCRKIQSADPSGIVTLSGNYWLAHEEEILNLVRNEEGRGNGVNPLERIMDIRREGDTLIIETTKEKLAQRIGHRLHSAHKGTVDYRWSDTNHLVRVYWERTLD